LWDWDKEDSWHGPLASHTSRKDVGGEVRIFNTSPEMLDSLPAMGFWRPTHASQNTLLPFN
jgi:hypothetical protein